MSQRQLSSSQLPPTSSLANCLPSMAAWASKYRVLPACQPLPPALFLYILVEIQWLERLRHRLPRQSRKGNWKAKKRRIVGAMLLREKFAGFAHLRRTQGCIVSVCREKMHPPIGEQLMSHSFGVLAHAAQQRSRRHLYKNPAPQPFDDTRLVGLKRRVSLRMRQDRCQSSELQLVEDLRQPTRQAVVGNLHQQVAMPVDTEPRWVQLG